jgi:hypothetical protein
VSRPKELARIAERMSKRFVGLSHVFQVSGQAVEELEGGELPLHYFHGFQGFRRQHGASEWFSTGTRVKY